jgi:hypothetical protein
MFIETNPYPLTEKDPNATAPAKSISKDKAVGNNGLIYSGSFPVQLCKSAFAV